MSAKLNTEIINERYKERGIQLVDEYVSATTRVRFRCSKNHEWISTTRSVNKTKWCHQCYCESKTPSFDEVNLRLSNTNVKMLFGYTDVKSKATFVCENGHTWKSQVSSVLNQGTRCPKCCHTNRLTKEVVNERIKDRGLKLVDEYESALTKSTFQCSEGHQWRATVDSVLRISSCPSCSKTGFDNQKSANLYILEFEGFLKYGITNVLESRLKSLKKNGKYNIITTKFFNLGKDAYELEKKIKTTIGGNFISKDKCKDGFTETLSLDKIEDLMKLVA